MFFFIPVHFWFLHSFTSYSDNHVILWLPTWAIRRNLHQSGSVVDTWLRSVARLLTFMKCHARSGMSASIFRLVRSPWCARMPDPGGVDSAIPSQCPHRPPQSIRLAMHVYPCRAENCHLQTSILRKPLFPFPSTLSLIAALRRESARLRGNGSDQGARQDHAHFSILFRRNSPRLACVRLQIFFLCLSAPQGLPHMHIVGFWCWSNNQTQIKPIHINQKLLFYQPHWETYFSWPLTFRLVCHVAFTCFMHFKRGEKTERSQWECAPAQGWRRVRRKRENNNIYFPFQLWKFWKIFSKKVASLSL